MKLDVRKTVGIDLGGTRIKGVVLDTDGQVLARKLSNTEDDGLNGWQKNVIRTVHSLWKEVGCKSPVGISAPGLAAADRRSIARMPGRLQGLEGLVWGDHLKVNTSVLNDAQAALLAEYHVGAAQGVQDVMMLTLGTGIGGALLLGGELYQGRYNRAGHLGHITLNPQASSGIIALPGTLEYLVGNAYLAERSKGAYTDTAQLLQACRAGHTVAMKVWDESMYYLALGISSLINVISPERIVLGGGMLEAGDDLWNPLRRYLDQYEWRPFGVATPIVAAQLKVYAGAVGAAFYARQEQEI